MALALSKSRKASPAGSNFKHATEREDRCSFRTMLADDSGPSLFDDDDTNNRNRGEQHDDEVVFDDAACVAVHRRLRVPAKLAPKLANSVPAGPVNPQMSDSQFAASNVMLCPEETGDAISLLGDTDLRDLFSTVEDFADTEMVHAPRQPKAKRRLSISSGPFSNTNKKRARTSTPTPPPTPTEAAPDPKPQPGKQDEEDILDEWIVTDISQIPSYGPSEIMEQQSHQLLRRILLGTAVAKARAARKAVGKMKRRYGSMTKDCLSSFHSGYKPTRCVAVGVAY